MVPVYRAEVSHCFIITWTDNSYMVLNSYTSFTVTPENWIVCRNSSVTASGQYDIIR